MGSLRGWRWTRGNPRRLPTRVNTLNCLRDKESRGRMCILGRENIFDRGIGWKAWWCLRNACGSVEQQRSQWGSGGRVERKLDRWAGPDGEKPHTYQFSITVNTFISLSSDTLLDSLNTLKWTHLSFPKFSFIYQMQISWGKDSCLAYYCVSNLQERPWHTVFAQ